MRIKILTLVMTLMCVSFAQAEIQGKEVQYEANGTTLKGYLAYDDAVAGKRPGVLVVHEWWGHNEYARKRAEMLAGLGYTALAVDMYGNGKQAAHPDEAGQFASEVAENAPVAKERFLAGLNFLKAQESVNPEKIAAIGYCFGGATVLNMARAGVDLKGVVSFHGSLATETPAQPGTVKAKVLVAHGAADSFIPQEDIDAFKKEMEAAGVDYKFVAYPEAKHSFTNPDADKISAEFALPIAYNAPADKKSWEDMQAFLQEVFKD